MALMATTAGASRRSGLTPDQRFAFDVKGYAVLPGALDPTTLAALRPRLDAFEALAVTHRGAHPAVEDGRFDTVGGKQIGLHIQDYGKKLWVMDLLSEDPGLAGLLAANALVRPYVEELVERPALQMFAARFQWQGAESEIHGSFVRDQRAGPGVRKGSAADPTGAAPGYHVLAAAPGEEAPRIQTSMFRLMFMLSDVAPGGGALRFIPGSHKRDVPWRPEGAALRSAEEGTYHPLSRYEELTPSQQASFVEVTGTAGTAVVFTHDLIHTSWHETPTHRRVVHLTFDQGGDDALQPRARGGGGSADDGGDAARWLDYLMRNRAAAEREAAVAACIVGALSPPSGAASGVACL
jgi:hypothetical protein